MAVLQQIIDLEAEGKALFGTLSARPDADFARVTAFKEWTIADVLRHLHIGDTMAELSVTYPDAFQRFRDSVNPGWRDAQYKRSIWFAHTPAISAFTECMAMADQKASHSRTWSRHSQAPEIARAW